jgi:nicotinamidase-related amidase
MRNMDINTCVVTGVTTCVCVSTTIRGGVEHNYHMIIVNDGVAEIHRDAHDAELKTMQRIFAEVMSTDELIRMLQADRPS